MPLFGNVLNMLQTRVEVKITALTYTTRCKYSLLLAMNTFWKSRMRAMLYRVRDGGNSEDETSDPLSMTIVCYGDKTTNK